ncbi:MAG: PIG-L deacetylase family protein [Caulobacteraceae bacterium]
MNARKDIEAIERFFTNPESGSFEGRAIAAFAHPDDATIAFGGQLGRFPDLDMIVVTDGAPTHLNYAADKGYRSTEAYAQIRWDEMESALSLIDVPGERVSAYGFDDGSVCRRLMTLIERLEKDLAGADIVMTHCFEGGHTDHDSVAMAVHLACAAIEEERRPVIVEAPLYSLQAGLFTTQALPAGGSGRPVAAPLTEEQQLLKRQIKICYSSQRYSLAQFKDDVEPCRIAPAYDFGLLPNNGALLYEVNGFMSGPQWLATVRMCLALLERSRNANPAAVTFDESVEILKKLVAAAPPSRAAAPAPTLRQYRMAGGLG